MHTHCDRQAQRLSSVNTGWSPVFLVSTNTTSSRPQGKRNQENRLEEGATHGGGQRGAGMTDTGPGAGLDRVKVLLFLAAFFQAVGCLALLASCGTDYWLLAWQSCSPARGQQHRTPSSRLHRDDPGTLTPGEPRSQAVGGGVTFFHEGLFWRCSSQAHSQTSSLWDIWTGSQPPIKVCESAFLFPFPVYESTGRPLVDAGDFPPQPAEPDSVIIFRTFWCTFLVVGVASVMIGGFIVISASPLSNHNLLRVGGAFQLSGGLSLVAVLVMFLTWFQALGVLEHYASARSAAVCPGLQLSVEVGPSFLLAPVAAFFSVVAGLLYIVIGRDTPGVRGKGSALRPAE